MAAGNVSETIYMAESLYLRFDIPTIMPAVIEALKAKNFDVSNINTTHVFFTVRLHDARGPSAVHRLWCALAGRVRSHVCSARTTAVYSLWGMSASGKKGLALMTSLTLARSMVAVPTLCQPPVVPDRVESRPESPRYVGLMYRLSASRAAAAVLLLQRGPDATSVGPVRRTMTPSG